MPGVEGTMHEFKEGTLKSSSGQKVTSRKQAIAIGLSEDRRAGKNVPPKHSDPVARRKAKQRASAKRAVESKDLPRNFTKGKAY